MSSTGLYTVMMESYRNREVWIEQLSVSNKSLRSVLSAWGNLVKEQGLLSYKDNESFQKDLDDDNAPVLLSGLSNVWYTCAVRSSDYNVLEFYIIKTDTRLLLNNTHVVPTSISDLFAETKYAQYKKKYHLLQGVKYRNKIVDKERRHVERWMRHWHIKLGFSNCSNTAHRGGYEDGLYTAILDYEGVPYFSQLHLSDTSSESLLATWAKLLLKQETSISCDARILCNEKDHTTLMDRVMDVVYQPVPTNGLVNVWGTYFALTKCTAYLTLIKTSLDEVVQE